MVKRIAHKKRRLEAESLLPRTRKMLRQSGIRPRKGLGQHFLVDGEVLQLIISAAELAPDDIIMEVGPGQGILTRELAKHVGWVIAIELDDKLAAILKQTLAPFDNITILNEDVLRVEPSAFLKEQKLVDSPVNYKVVANLPYYITSPVLRHFLEASVKPEIMVIMVQKEVAEAIVAEPGRMSLLSVSVQFYGEPRIISYISAQSFYPVPKVDSAILRVEVYPQPPVQVEESSFFELVRAGFNVPRKQICNSLAQGMGLPKAGAMSLLEKAGISPQRRAETLTLEEWAQLWQVSREEPPC